MKKYRASLCDMEFFESFYGSTDPSDAGEFTLDELKELHRGWSIDVPFEDWLGMHFDEVEGRAER